MKGSALSAALAALLVVAGCATKEITLTFADAARDAPDASRDGADAAADVTDAAADVTDAAAERTHFPGPFCLSFDDSATGEGCMVCYDEWGVELSRVCKPPTQCMIREDPSLTRCLYCDDVPSMPRACLKCDPGPADAGLCGGCQWSDDATTMCRRCLDAAGTLDYAQCDSLRAELGKR